MALFTAAMYSDLSPLYFTFDMRSILRAPFLFKHHHHLLLTVQLQRRPPQTRSFLQYRPAPRGAPSQKALASNERFRNAARDWDSPKWSLRANETASAPERCPQVHAQCSRQSQSAYQLPETTVRNTNSRSQADRIRIFCPLSILGIVREGWPKPDPDPPELSRPISPLFLLLPTSIRSFAVVASVQTFSMSFAPCLSMG